ncbi:MAG: FAD:protein FMN transferase [Anaerolineae bacterium]|nr:FAD:protein FMN transferase [Anaerolineales bacterium]MCQ3973947.1 FAD:protein FMN transferase [Anaerolineae bacterium]
MMRLTTPTQQPWRWTGYSFRAMNTKVQTWLYSQTDSAVLLDVQRLFASFEKRLSRFDPQSELSRLNTAAGEAFQASPILLDALEAALLAAEATGGLYDPTTLPALEQAGYDRSFEYINQAAPSTPVLPDSRFAANQLNRISQPSYTYRSVTLNRAKREVYKPAGVRLDLGGMGKGWTVDRAADKLHGLGPFLLNAGGDIFAYHSPPGQKGWEIDLVHPLQPEANMARLLLHHRALATSTIAKRRWQRQGQTMHHLIDPRTGQPAQTDAVSVSVVADRTMTAEIYAKVALILGAELGLAYLQSLPTIEGLIFTADSQILFTPGLAPLLERVEPAGYLN